MTWGADLVKHCTHLTIGKHIEQKPERGGGKYEAGRDSNSWVASAFPTLNGPRRSEDARPYLEIFKIASTGSPPKAVCVWGGVGCECPGKGILAYVTSSRRLCTRPVGHDIEGRG